MTDNSDSQNKAEELLSQSKSQSRLNSDPAASHSDAQDTQLSLSDAVAEAYEELDDGDRHQNLTVRDADLAALVAGLEETNQLNSVSQRAYDRLGLEDHPDSKADFIKASIRVALLEIAEEEVEAAKKGKRKHLIEQTDTF